MGKGFEIKCLECGSTDVSIKYDSDYGYDGEDEYFVQGDAYLQCNNCGYNNLYE